MNFPDLHNHLYGSISADTLYEIGKRNPNPRWNLFTDLHKKIYGKEIRTESFFRDYKDIEDFRNLYFFNKPAPFIEFQSKFNLIIALSKFDEEEIRYVAKEIVSAHAKQGINFAEYRIMYPPSATKEVYFSKTIAAIDGIYQGEISVNKAIQARLVVSLHRDGDYFQQYQWLKELMNQNELVKNYLVGVDFCYIEEGFPPREKKEFFKKILEDNQEYPETALSILYHVGESFSDKTPKSAVRWVGESAIWGAHRLGHCISLGINPESFANKIIQEKVSERIDQIEFEIKYYEKLKSLGATTDYSKLQKELELLKQKNSEDKISFSIDKRYIDEIYTMQEFTMFLIKEESNSTIECCPTSNLLIGMLPEIKNHPIGRFKKNDLRITISSDDPGIFDTNIKKEYELAATAGLSLDELEEIKKLSSTYTSEKLSGRK